jgi:hypothetical protein
MQKLKRTIVGLVFLYAICSGTVSYSESHQAVIEWLEMTSKWRDARTKFSAIKEDMLEALEADKSSEILMLTDFVGNVERICSCEEHLFAASAWMDDGNKAGYYDHRARLMKDSRRDVEIYLDGLTRERRILKDDVALSLVDKAINTIRSLLELFDETMVYIKGESERLRHLNTSAEKQ